MPIVVAIVLVVALVLAVPQLRKQQQQTETSTRCRNLEEQIEAMSTAGGDEGQRASTEAQLRSCIADLRAQGVDVDESRVSLAVARARATQIAQEWGNYRSTKGEDAVKRNNTRDNILRIGSEMVNTIRRAASEASSPASLAAVAAFAREQIDASLDRAACILGTASGCSRYGLNEPDWDQRAADELTRVAYPLGARQALESGDWHPTPEGDPDELARLVNDEIRDRDWARVRIHWRLRGDNAAQLPAVIQAWNDNTNTAYADILARRAALTPRFAAATRIDTPALRSIAASFRTMGG